MRFEVTNVLDAIERHLTTEAALAQVAVDLGEIAWFEALDGGRPATSVRRRSGSTRWRRGTCSPTPT
jgi:hypothetical protein